LGIHAPVEADFDAFEGGVLAPQDASSTDASTHLSDAGSPDAGGSDFASRRAFATWPMPNPPTDAHHPMSYAVQSDEVVRDQITQLEWVRSAPSELYAWQDASAYCDQLTVAGGGFRLPSRIELLSLLDPSRVSPAIDSDVFPDQPGSPYWSDSPLADNHARRWAIELQFSTQFALPRELDEPLRVRCVRESEDRAAPSPARFMANAGVVRDLGTQLTWQADDAPSSLSQADALSYCAGLPLDGGGFRLPTLKELHTLVDEGRTLPAADPAFVGTDSEGYWSATPLAQFPRSAWFVNFARGIDGFAGVDTPQHVRCVR